MHLKMAKASFPFQQMILLFYSKMPMEIAMLGLATKHRWLWILWMC